MAYDLIPVPVPAQQPDLRTFIIFDHLPDGCFVFEVVDNCVAPHVRAGEFVIVDPTSTTPIHGEHFLIEWNSGRQQVVEVGELPRPEQICDWDGVATFWNAYVNNPCFDMAGEVVSVSRWFDGPYTEDGFAKKLVGQIVGIYQPDFRQQLKLIV